MAKARRPRAPLNAVRIMRQDYLTFGSPHIGEEEIAEVVATLRSGWIGTGPKVGAFEQAFAEYVGAEHAIAVSSCTAALHLSVLVSGIGPGDEIITTPMTFCATANAIVHAGVKPVFADIDLRTMNVDPGRIEAAITPATKAIIPVHFAGRPCDMEAICDIAARHGLMVIEDAAHAIESRTTAAKIGTIGDLSCFSFYVTKNVATAEGGMITTDRSEWVDRLKTSALHGMNRDAWQRYSDAGFKHYQVESPGFKYNMTDIQASLGLHQLKRVDANLRRREEIWRRYDEAFAEWPLQTPLAPASGEVHARHLYTCWLMKPPPASIATPSNSACTNSTSAPASTISPCTCSPTTRRPGVIRGAISHKPSSFPIARCRCRSASICPMAMSKT